MAYFLGSQVSAQAAYATVLYSDRGCHFSLPLSSLYINLRSP